MKPNTKLTSIELRWLKETWKKGEFGKSNQYTSIGSRQLAKRINDGRKRVGVELISRDVINYAIKRIENGGVLVPINPPAIKNRLNVLVVVMNGIINNRGV